MSMEWGDVPEKEAKVSKRKETPIDVLTLLPEPQARSKYTVTYKSGEVTFKRFAEARGFVKGLAAGGLSEGIKVTREARE
jgi:hypothetical protein